MTITDGDRVARLRALGLTEYQAKGYVALVRLGRGTAAQLARVTDVPRNKLYPAMQELNTLGLAETQLGEAQVYRPLPLGPFVDRRAAALRAEAGGLDEARATLEADFGATGGAGGAPGGYRLYQGRARTLEQLRLALRGARDRVAMVASPGTPARMLASGEADILRERLDDGIAVRLLVPAGAEQGPLAALEGLLGDAIQVAARPGFACVLLAIDGTLTIQAQLEPDDAALEGARDVCLVSASPMLAGVIETHLALLRERGSGIAPVGETPRSRGVSSMP